MKLGLGMRGLSFGGSGGPPKPVTDFFNGFEMSGSTYSGGPTVVPDNTGALVTSPAGVLPMTGMRLATTVATGAVLGPELIVDGGFDNPVSWITGTGVSVTNSSAVFSNTNGGFGSAQGSQAISGKRYMVAYEIKSIASGGLRCGANGANGTIRTTPLLRKWRQSVTCQRY